MDKSKNHAPRSLRPEGSAAAAQREGLVGPCYVSRARRSFSTRVQSQPRARAYEWQRRCFNETVTHCASTNEHRHVQNRARPQGAPGAEGVKNRRRRRQAEPPSSAAARSGTPTPRQPAGQPPALGPGTGKSGRSRRRDNPPLGSQPSHGRGHPSHWKQGRGNDRRTRAVRSQTTSRQRCRASANERSTWPNDAARQKSPNLEKLYRIILSSPPRPSQVKISLKVGWGSVCEGGGFVNKPRATNALTLQDTPPSEHKTIMASHFLHPSDL